MSPKAKRPDPQAAADWIAGGHDHRPKHEARLAQAKDAEPSSQEEPRRGGRPKAFGGKKTARLNLMLPEDLVDTIVITARREKKTPGELVAEILAPKLMPEQP